MRHVADATLGPLLESLHEQIRGELDLTLSAACHPQAGVWDRWAAVRFVEAEARPALLAERKLVDAVMPSVPAGAHEHLWAVGELLVVLARRLCELGRLPQGGAEFLQTAEKFRLAFGYWCGSVELHVGPLDRSLVPDLHLARLAQLEQAAVHA
jgi:hypothetical protein